MRTHTLVSLVGLVPIVVLVWTLPTSGRVPAWHFFLLMSNAFAWQVFFLGPTLLRWLTTRNGQPLFRYLRKTFALIYFFGQTVAFYWLLEFAFGPYFGR